MFPDWSGRLAVCIASGPSLSAADCDLVRASGHPVVVTNTTFRLCHWAQALFGYDFAWWQAHIEEVRRVFSGKLYSKTARTRNLGVSWVEQDARFRPFCFSGACAVSLAIAAGAKRVVLLGHDMQFTGGKSHHHGNHPEGLKNCESMPTWAPQFARLARYAKQMGVDVVNATRETALVSFERRALESCL